MPRPRYSLLDHCCLAVDRALRALLHNPKTTGAPYPAEGEHADLNEAERKHAASLLRINHAGEICAQALYHGQAVVCRSQAVADKLEQAAIEEGDHLSWCHLRLEELSSHPSYLNPLWYAGSFCIGMVAGMVGDRWSLGFVAETERQVVQHLSNQIALLPSQDARSYKILAKMEADEAKHRDEAIALGAATLPDGIKKAMTMTSAVMVKVCYWV